MAWKQVELPDFIHDYDFVKLAKKEASPRVRIRLLAMSNLQNGKSLTSVASSFKVCYQTVSRWLKNFTEEGLAGLRDKAGNGRKSKFDYSSSVSLKNDIDQLNQDCNGGRIQAKDVQKLLKEKYSSDYKKSAVYNLLHKIGFSWVSCRSKHPNSNPSEQEAFKKTLKKL